MPLLDLTDTGLAYLFPDIPVAVAHSNRIIFDSLPAIGYRTGQEGCEMRFHSNWAATRAATTVWLTEGLVEIVVDCIETHPTRVSLA